MEEIFNPQVFFVFLGIPVTKTVVSTWVVMGFLVLFSFLLTRRMRPVPTRLQNVLELFVEAILHLVEEMSPGNGKRFLPLVGTLALFIGTSDLAGLVPWLRSPTSDFNTTLALALVVFLAVPFYGIATKGVRGYFRSYLSPSPILAPFHVISEITRTISLALRLFGQHHGGGNHYRHPLPPLSAFPPSPDDALQYFHRNHPGVHLHGPLRGVPERCR